MTIVKTHLLENNIKDFNSLNEVINFQKNYLNYRQQIITNQEHLIEQEKNILSAEISNLDNFIIMEKIEAENKLLLDINRLKQQFQILSSSKTNIIQSFTNYFKRHYLKNKISDKEHNLYLNISYSIQPSVNKLAEKQRRFQFIVSNFTDAVNESSNVPLKQLERKKRIIDEINSSIYGALGEQKVVKELENLSDEYFLINDFSISFSTAIYNKQENDYIKSIQIDHVLISPSGIFIIETKNWSEHSIRNRSFRSPIQQIKRTNYAMFKILSGEINNYNLNLDQHHWGNRKIPIRNLVVMTNSKPTEDFQFVKVLTLNELLSYIKYFKQTFSNKETIEIANYLLRIGQNKVLKF